MEQSETVVSARVREAGNGQRGRAVGTACAHARAALRGHEAQITQAVAAISSADPTFATEFVALVLEVAARDRRYVDARPTKWGGCPSGWLVLGGTPYTAEAT